MQTIRNIRYIVLLFLLVAIIGVFIWINQSRNQSDIQKFHYSAKIVMGTFLKALGNAPYHVAKEKGWFAEDPDLAGSTIEFHEFADRTMISNAFTANALHVLFSAEIPVILTKAQGNDIKIIAVSAIANQEILVQNDSSVETVPDLINRSIAVLPSTSSHYGLLKILEANGLSDKSVNLRLVGPDLARVAFEQGELDAWAVWAPWVEQQEISGKGRVLPESNAIIASVMTVSSSLINDYDKQAQAIHRIIQRAKKWIVDNPEEAKEIAARELHLSPAVVEQAWDKFHWDAQLDETVLEDIQQKAAFLAKEDMTRKSKELDVGKDLIELKFYKKEP